MRSLSRGASRLGVLLLALVLAALAGTAWWFLRSSESQQGSPTESTRAVDPRADPVPQVVEATPRPDDVVVAQREDVVVPAPLPGAFNPPPAAYTAALSGIRGRLVEEDGKPVADKPVELLALKLEPILGDFVGFLEQPPDELLHFDVAHATSDKEGLFVLHGADSHGMHVLGVDLGGARSTFRILDVTLERGQNTDLGDVVLSPYVTFTGKVNDEEGAPIAGARVRVIPPLPVPIPPQVLAFGLQDLRADSAVAAGIDGMNLFIELPNWMKPLLDKLPLPTTRTGADGEFRLAGVPAGLVTLVVDRPGYLGVVRAGLPTGRRTEQNVGTCVLTSGRTLSGRVEAGKQPLAGLRVCAGASIEIDGEKVAILQPAGRTDGDGRFTLRGVPINGGALFAVQRFDGAPWTVVGPFDGDDVKIELPATATIDVLVQDGTGRPVDDARLRLIEPSPPGFPPFFLQHRDFSSRIEPKGKGHYLVVDVAVGTWLVQASAPGCGSGSQSVDVAASGATVLVELPPERRAVVHVTDETTGEPIEHAAVSALHTEGFMPSYIGWARTDVEGRAELERLPRSSERLILRVVHPAYVPASLQLQKPGNGGSAAEVVEFKLSGGGTLVGSMLVADASPPKPCMLLLDHRGNEKAPEDEMPRFALTLPDGSFRVTHLAPGEFGYKVYPRFLFCDPLEFVKKQFSEPDELATGSFTIEQGKETRLDISVASMDAPLPGTVRGIVRINGKAAEGLTVNVENRGTTEQTTDSAGRFEFTEVRAGDVTLWVFENSSGNTMLHSERFQLPSAGIKDLDLDLRPLELVVLVRTADGQPAASARIEVTRIDEEGHGRGAGGSSSGRTDDSGRATVMLSGPGKWSVSAHRPEQGRVAQTVEVPDSGRSAPVELTLDPGTTCSGRIEFDGEVPADPEWQLHFDSIEDAEGKVKFGADSVEVDQAARTFVARGIVPGRYQVWLFGASRRPMRSEPIDVPAGGSTSLVLRMKSL